MVSVGSPYFSRFRAGLVTSCSVTALSPWPMACSALAAIWDSMLKMVDVQSMRAGVVGVGPAVLRVYVIMSTLSRYGCEGVWIGGGHDG
jgi:RsiW-degrading membrane proteinase PrsW (M82 family)